METFIVLQKLLIFCSRYRGRFLNSNKSFVTALGIGFLMPVSCTFAYRVHLWRGGGVFRNAVSSTGGVCKQIRCTHVQSGHPVCYACYVYLSSSVGTTRYSEWSGGAFVSAPACCVVSAPRKRASAFLPVC